MHIRFKKEILLCFYSHKSAWSRVRWMRIWIVPMWSLASTTMTPLGVLRLLSVTLTTIHLHLALDCCHTWCTNTIRFSSEWRKLKWFTHSNVEILFYSIGQNILFHMVKPPLSPWQKNTENLLYYTLKWGCLSSGWYFMFNSQGYDLTVPVL